MKEVCKGIIVGLYPELLTHGGVQRVGRHTAAVLSELARERDWSCRFLSLNDPVGIHSVQVASIPFSIRGYGRKKSIFTISALQALTYARVAYVSHPHLAPLGWTLKLFRPDLSFWVTAHGVDVWNRLSWLVRASLRIAERVTAPSLDTADKLVSMQGVERSKISVIPWALEPDLFCSNGSNPAPNSRKVILTVSRLADSDRSKGVDTVIRALPEVLRRVPETRLVIVGDGNDRSRLERLANDLDISDRVLFAGSPSDSDLANHYRACDVFVLPSKKEGFGLVFLEAMAYGKPVIGGNHGGTPDVIQDGETGFLVNHEDVTTLTDRLVLLLRDEPARRRMGAAARRRLDELYTFDRFRQRFVDLFEVEQEDNELVRNR